jgi:hypothetical protein
MKIEHKYTQGHYITSPALFLKRLITDIKPFYQKLSPFFSEGSPKEDSARVCYSLPSLHRLGRVVITLNKDLVDVAGKTP